MTLLKKLITTLRGNAREFGQAIVDANQIRILEQELHDAKCHLEQSKESLTAIMAEEMKSSRSIVALDKQIDNYTYFAKEALRKNDEVLALELSEHIADCKKRRKEQHEIVMKLSVQGNNLKSMIMESTKSLEGMERELLIVKTTDQVQKASFSINKGVVQGQSKINSASKTLEEIKRKQQILDDRLKADKILGMEFNTSANMDMKLKKKIKNH